MRFIISRVLATFALLLVISYPSLAQDLMKLDELESFLEASPNHEIPAYFDTVLRGTRIQKIDINIRGILDSGGQKIIIFVTSKNIAGGMSGSPVYVNGKLVGAVAYQMSSFNFSSWKWGGISPIEKMVNDSESGLNSNLLPKTNFNYRGISFIPIPLGSGVFSEHLSGSESKLAKQGFVRTSSGSGNDTQYYPTKLKAGMPIIVDVIEWEDERGEKVSLGALGTITYIDKEGKIYAFGHPFLDAKKVRYGFRTAEIMGTNDSESDANKIPGHFSKVLGTINFDSSYGIYGRESLDGLDELHNFNLELQNSGGKFNSFKIKVAHASSTPNLVGFALSRIGKNNNISLSEESGVTEIKAKFNLAGHEPLFWEELFSPFRFVFGASVISTSSYDVAVERLVSGIYVPLFRSNYNFKINSVDIVANFIPGQMRTLRIADYKFPNKVIWGEDPTFELTMVGEDNSIVATKKLLVGVNWDKVEKPVYTKDTLDTDKQAEKTTFGFLYLYSADNLGRALFLDSEKHIYNPQYFLNADDFLDLLSNRLRITSQRIFAKIYLKPRSGLFGQSLVPGQDNPNQSNHGSGWTIQAEGLKERAFTVKNEDSVPFNIDLPLVPSGYVVGSQIFEVMRFEVILN